ncbi:MAG: septum site-determining protein MinC [Deltaproteobacteria bacterium]|nr:septum site-determining protein MinC [Deltaproteobacteria bacterium]
MESNDQDIRPLQVKGIGNNLTVLFDPRQPLDDLKKELRRVFDPVKHLSANAHIVLDAGDEEGHEALYGELGAFLKATYPIGAVTGAARDRLAAVAAATVATKERLRQKGMEGSLYHRQSDVLMMTGLVRSGQKINARKHFLLLGDLNPGGEVIAGGDIVIMGSLRGKASAGHPGNESALIVALDFRPIQIQIGSLVAAGGPTSKGKTVEFAHVQNGVIVVDDYVKTNPFGGLPWPEVR